MEKLTEFGKVAKDLSRNPLGILALFIVLVYGVAGLVISLAKPEFYSNATHPAVIFVAAFPFIVLFTFAYLVACHHTKLYAPRDFDRPDDFWRNEKVPDAILRANTPQVVTSNGNVVALAGPEAAALAAEYARIKDMGYSMLHRAEVVHPRTAPKNGLYRVRVWIERFGTHKLSEIEAVTYRLWPDLEQDEVTSTSAESNFDLWLTVYGEFPVLAKVQLKSGESITLQRYMDLPDRPPD